MEGRAEPRPVANDALIDERILASLVRLSETRVRALDFSGATRAEPLTFLTDRAHQTSSTFSRGFASDLVGFLSEDPLAGWLPRNLLGPGEVNEVYRYAGNDPVLNRDPLGLKKCGPVPSPGPNCESNCAARMEWGLCSLHNNMSSLIYTEIAFGGGGAVAGFLCGGPPGALIGAGAGLVIGIGFHHYFYVPATEAAIRRTYDNCVRQCQTMKCGDTGEGPCGQPPGGPKGPSVQ